MVNVQSRQRVSGCSCENCYFDGCHAFFPLSHWTTLTRFAEALRQKLAQVDKKQFVDDLIFMPGHLFEHREQTRGRADFVADDEAGKGYYIEEKPPSPRRFSGPK